MTTDERYRLVDPRTCLVCGDRPSHYHFPHICSTCDQATSWGGRFTWTKTRDEVNQDAANVAAKLGTSVAYALETWCVEVIDYTDKFVGLLRALGDFYASDGTHSGGCLPDDPQLSDAVDLAELESAVRCPLCHLHYRKVLLCVDEDKRHGLPPCTTFYACETADRDAMLARRAEQLKDTSLDDIVARSLQEQT